jgi:peptidoglycan/LPS O-acetylase OafA/YrhL
MLTLAPPTSLQRQGQETPVWPTAERDPRPGLAYRPDIDGLRAIAVAAVAGYHAFPGALTGGFVGVDVFFVISGYLITQLIVVGLRTGRFSIREFYRRRVRRLVPALLVVLLVCGAAGGYLLLPDELLHLSRSITWSTLFLANGFFVKNGNYFDPTTEVSPMLHLWSLGVEEQFYFAWPVLMMLAFRRGQTRAVLLAVMVSSLAISLWGGWHAIARYFFQPGARAWELAAGGLLAVSATPGMLGRRASVVASLAGLTLIGASVRLLDPGEAFPGARALLPTGGALLLIAAGSAAPVNRYLLASRPMVLLGQISYPLYLWHWPLLSFARIVLGRPAPPLLAAALIGIAVLAAYATYRLVERPIRFGGGGKPWAVPLLLAGLGAMTIASAAVQWHAIRGRLSGPAFLRWDAAATDWNVPLIHEADGAWTATLASHRAPKALFIGDSHIQNLIPRIQHVIAVHPDSARTAVFTTYLGCPPLPDLDGTQFGSRCTPLFDRAWRQAMAADVDTVVFGAYWESYLMGQFSPIVSTRGPAYKRNDQLQPPLGLDSPSTQRALQGFERSIASLVASGRRVFIVLSNPTSPDFDPLFLFPAEARLALHPPDRIEVDPPKRSVNAAAYEAYVQPLMMRLRDIAARTGAHVLDPRSTLCDGMLCPTIGADGVPTHLDNNHLTSSYARERAGFLDEILLGKGG